MSENGSPCVLITIPISHFCEKARWALDRAGVAYEERAHLQLIHRFAVRRAGGAPPRRCWSAAIGSFPSRRRSSTGPTPRPRLTAGSIPTIPSAAAEIRALEHDFDERLGPHGRRWMYNGIRGRKDLAVAYAATGVPAWERRTLPIVYPAVARGIDRILDITPEGAVRSEAKVRDTFDEVAERLSDGRPYLCGERFTAADLTFSALAAAVLMPPEYGVPLPQPDELPAAAAEVVRELRAHPAGAHALAMYRSERR